MLELNIAKDMLKGKGMLRGRRMLDVSIKQSLHALQT